MIDSIRLQKWKSHLDSRFAFSRGTNGLVGIMGSGKSSVLDALSFALYGTFPALKSRKLSLDDVIMSSPQEMKSASVELAFSFDGKLYEVRRSIEKGRGTKAEIRENGTLLDVGPSSVTKVVTETLKMDYDLFSRAVYSEQNSLDFFLTIPKGQRMKIIDSLLKIDLFEKARSSSVSLANRLEYGVKESVKSVEEMEKGFDIGKEKALEDEIFNGRAQKKAEEKRLDEKQSSLREKEMELGEMEKISRETAKLRLSIGRNEGIIYGLQRELELLGEETPVNLAEAEEGLHESSRALMEEEEKENTIRSKAGSLSLRKKELQKSNTRIRDMKTCPVCLMSMDESHREGASKEIEAEIVGIDEELDDLSKELGLIKKVIEEKRAKRESCENLLAEGRERERARKRRETCFSEMGERKKKLAEEKISLKGLEEKWSEDRFSRMAKEREELLEEASALRQKILGLEELFGEKEETLRIIKERRESLERVKEETRENEELLGSMKTFNSALLATQDELRKLFVDEVNEAMGRVWEHLYPYGDFSSARIVVSEGDYSLELLRKDGWTDAELASGGEKSIACLALRIAFSLALAPNLRWLVLDEPTHNLDSRAVEALAEVLHERASSLVEQIFLITHDERLENAVTGSLYHLGRDKGRGEPTRIEIIEQAAI